jgi:hypothetical protein
LEYSKPGFSFFWRFKKIQAAPKKRGPQPQLEKQKAAIASLLRKEQQQLLAIVEAFISQHAAR